MSHDIRMSHDTTPDSSLKRSPATIIIWHHATRRSWFGLGFADLENDVRYSPNTVMRIACISKPLSMTAVAKLWEEEKLDLDAPIQKYIPKYPVKTYDGKEVTITTRQLISHKSDIRHYYKLKDPNKKDKRDKENDASTEDSKVQSQSWVERESIVLGNETDEEKKNNLSEGNDDKNKEQKENQNNTGRCSCGKRFSKKRKSRKKKKEKEEDEFDLEECYFTDEFESVAEALEMFQNDDLFFKPEVLHLSGFWSDSDKESFFEIFKRTSELITD